MDKHIGQIFKGITQYRGTRLGPNYIEQESQNAQHNRQTFHSYYVYP